MSLRLFIAHGLGSILLLMATLPSPAAAQVPPYITQWGGGGSGPGQFNGPGGIAVDVDGNVFVADYGNNRVQKFTSSGVFLAQWGTHGSANGQFNGPEGLAVDPGGNVYVADFGNNRVQKFTSSGVYVTQWGTTGTGAGQFNFPLGVAVDASGFVYVADNGNWRVQKFTGTGAYVSRWGTPGSGDGQFFAPTGLAVDVMGNVYVGDTGNGCSIHNDRVQKFSSSGVYLGQWGTHGSGDGQFGGACTGGPWGIAVDAHGIAYVADYGNNRVEVFNDAGLYLGQWGTSGGGPSEFSRPYSVALDNAGNVYVAEVGNNRVQKFGAMPTPVTNTSWGHIKTMYR